MRSSLFAAMAVAAAAALSSGCAISANERQVGTAAGAVVGGTVGHVLTGGSALGTVGGAAAGAVIGGELGERKKPRSRKDD